MSFLAKMTKKNGTCRYTINGNKNNSCYCCTSPVATARNIIIIFFFKFIFLHYLTNADSAHQIGYSYHEIRRITNDLVYIIKYRN
jgi:hypothetical protein